LQFLTDSGGDNHCRIGAKGELHQISSPSKVRRDDTETGRLPTMKRESEDENDKPKSAPIRRPEPMKPCPQINCVKL